MKQNETFQKFWGNLSTEEQQAIAFKVWESGGGEHGGLQALEELLRDDLEVELRDPSSKLADQTGRCIPLMNMRDDVFESNTDFHIVQTEINYTAILARLQQFFAPGMRLVSAEEFENCSTNLIGQIQQNKQVRNLLKGAHLPICIPKLEIDDYGQVIETIFLNAVKRSYEAWFPGRTFFNYRAGTLTGQVGIAVESRHQLLVSTMSEKPVVGIYFPNPLQGFSVLGDRQMIDAFPDGFLLGGVIDIATAIIAKPDMLARDYNTPGLDCAANTWRSPGFSLHFRTYDYEIELGFDRKNLHPHNHYSGSILFVG